MSWRSCWKVVVEGLRRMGVGSGSRAPGVALLIEEALHGIEHSLVVGVVFASIDAGRWAPWYEDSLSMLEMTGTVMRHPVLEGH